MPNEGCDKTFNWRAKGRLKPQQPRLSCFHHVVKEFTTISPCGTIWMIILSVNFVFSFRCMFRLVVYVYERSLHQLHTL